MREAAPVEPSRYRLCGKVGAVERAFPLVRGENRIGSVRDNEVVVPVRGVSRHHALLTWDPSGLALADLDSKNGVFVNRTRVHSARLHAGDELRLGPVVLRLEPVEAGDVELAIALSRTDPAGLPSGETTAVSAAPAEGLMGAWLELVEGFLSRIAVPPLGDLAGALALLVRALGAQGACVVEGAAGPEPLVLAAFGALEDLSRHDPAREMWEQTLRADSSEGCSTALFADPLLACGVLSGPGRQPLGLAVWGDFRGRAESEPLLRVLLRLLERYRPRPVHVPVQKAKASIPGLEFLPGYVAGESPVMSSLHGQMLPLVRGDLPVLILGETGVGKEYLARILHASSPRRSGPFVAINCAAIPADLLEAELFGIGKGIATGVVERPGRFQLAQGGTLFLDEIGDMSLDLQAKLLRALQEKEIQPVGGAPISVDIRVVAATNMDLLARIEEGRFRRDLYYRVAGYALRVPPLRERREDVPALVESFIRTFSSEADKAVRGITVKALQSLVDYPWPGNIRELEHEVRRLVYLCPEGQAIDSTMLSPQLRAERSEEARSAPAPLLPPSASLDLDVNLERLEAQLIRSALDRSGGNRTQAAKLLGISRNGLGLKMERLGIAN